MLYHPLSCFAIGLLTITSQCNGSKASLGKYNKQCRFVEPRDRCSETLSVPRHDYFVFVANFNTVNMRETWHVTIANVIMALDGSPDPRSGHHALTRCDNQAAASVVSWAHFIMVQYMMIRLCTTSFVMQACYQKILWVSTSVYCMVGRENCVRIDGKRINGVRKKKRSQTQRNDKEQAEEK